MAIRSIRTIGDAILEKKTKAVKEMTGRLKELISDMFDTMYDANGVGLAAPQVGVLKQIFVVDIGDGKQYVAINPEITVVGEEVQTGEEGCLSVPGKEGVVTRPMHIKVKALDQNMKTTIYRVSSIPRRWKENWRMSFMKNWKRRKKFEDCFYGLSGLCSRKSSGFVRGGV